MFHWVGRAGLALGSMQAFGKTEVQVVSLLAKLVPLVPLLIDAPDCPYLLNSISVSNVTHLSRPRVETEDNCKEHAVTRTSSTDWADTDDPSWYIGY